MYIRSGRFRRSRRGVSEVLGALLLIIVVVVAVAALASFVAIAQTNAQTRSNYLTNVKNENLQVTFAQFKANTTKSVVFPRSDPSLWNMVNLTIRNTNTASSQLTQVKAGIYWFAHWNEINPTTGKITINSTSGKHLVYGIGKPPLLIPAKGTVGVLLNFTTNKQVAPARNASITITLLTAAGNFFSTVFSPPNAVGQVGLNSVSSQYFNRDVVSLDGSKSQNSNSSQIVSYRWTVGVIDSTKAPCTSAAFGNPSNFKRVILAGKLSQMFLEAFQNSTLQPLRNFCLTGPFQASLSVFDTLGFIGNGSTVMVPVDSNMAPTAQVTASQGATTCTAGTATISGRVFNVFGAAVSNAIVLTTHTGTATLNPSYPTNAAGLFTISLTPCTAPVSVTISVNSLPSQTFIFNT